MMILIDPCDWHMSLERHNRIIYTMLINKYNYKILKLKNIYTMKIFTYIYEEI